MLVRSDMDALPVPEQTGLPYASQNAGVMHACGHDVHMTTLLGTAKMLADLKSQWRGTVMLIGQPAEEVVKGAEGMLADRSVRALRAARLRGRAARLGHPGSGEDRLSAGPVHGRHRLGEPHHPRRRRPRRRAA